MDHRSLGSSPGVGNRRTTRVGIEHELLVRDASTGRTGRDRAGARRRRQRRTPLRQLRARRPGRAEPALRPGAHGRGRGSRRTVAALRADCARAGIVLGRLPRRPPDAGEVPLQLTSPRYDAMEAHFDTIGPAGRRMMRRTASTQVCLDWWPGEAGLEQWRVLAPRRAVPRRGVRTRTGRAGSRLATWLAVDPDRTAFDDRLLAATTRSRRTPTSRAAPTPFTGPDEHLSTLFPPVRPRGRYLEVRFLDVQPRGAGRARSSRHSPR